LACLRKKAEGNAFFTPASCCAKKVYYGKA
jgi:hypothetical protein